MLRGFAAVAVSALAVVVVVEATWVHPNVENLSAGWGPELHQKSGYISVNKKDNGAHIFFWAFESRGDPAKDPLVLWMTGGPGCSSELAVFYEQGPYRLSKDGKVTRNDNAWNNNANVIFVDQPVGTGFSYADNEDDYVVNEEQVGEDMFEFMQTFYEQFPQYKTVDFFVTGESYAGHYVPAVANRIFKGNQRKEGFQIPMKGFAIGNGMVNARWQYPDYLPYAEEKGLIKSKIAEKIVEGETFMCGKLIDGKSMGAMAVCNSIIMTLQQTGHNFNVYDVREECKHPPLCYDFSPLDTLMARKDVQASLGVSEKAHWSECNMKVHAYLMNDWFTDCSTYLPEMLEAGIKALIYHGTEDFICNYRGGMDWAEKLKWSGQDDYNKSEFGDWLVKGKKAGEVKKAGSLIFLKVLNAGHMVPMNQPENALEMLRELVSDDSFSGQSPLPSYIVRNW